MTAQPANLSGIDIRSEIERLRKERNAVILAHYYQKPEIQDLADFVGDSLDLSRKAAATDADVIAFCGVKFMADTAKILSPQKIVILPDMDAGCSLEDSCPPEKFKAFAIPFLELDPSIAEQAFKGHASMYYADPRLTEAQFKTNLSFINTANVSSGLDPMPASLTFASMYEPSIAEEAMKRI